MPPEPLVILIDAPLPTEKARRLRELSPRITLIEKPSREAIARAEVLYTTEPPWTPADAPRLKWIQADTAAVNMILRAPLGKAGLPITNVRGAYSIAVAEFSIGLLLVLTRRLHKCRDMQTRRAWLPAEEYPTVQGDSLFGKTLGVVGYGSIGRHAARIARGFGMKVLACKRNPEVRAEDGFRIGGVGDPEGALPEAWFGIERVREMFARTDVALVTLPSTPATVGLIAKREIDALPGGAYVLSVGRGGVIDEAPLADALRDGRLAGAGLDVFANEPLEDDSPFWTLPNVVIAPHIASYTTDQQGRAADVLIENVRRYLAGEPLMNRIDPEQGY